jgi:hypothetical protein
LDQVACADIVKRTLSLLKEYLECMENYQAEKMAGGNPLHCTDLTPADEMGLILVQAHLDQGKRVYAGASCSDFE